MSKRSLIEDENSLENKESVVFVRVPEEGIDLYEIKENCILKIGDTMVKLRKTDEYFDEVETWIKSNNLEKIKP